MFEVYLRMLVGLAVRQCIKKGMAVLSTIPFFKILFTICSHYPNLANLSIYLSPYVVSMEDRGFEPLTF